MIRVRISDRAEADFAESMHWYADNSLKAAKLFESAFADAVSSIAENPTLYPLFDERHRYYLMQRFPFEVIYRELSADDWLIVAVAHASRRPNFWADR